MKKIVSSFFTLSVIFSATASYASTNFSYEAKAVSLLDAVAHCPSDTLADLMKVSDHIGTAEYSSPKPARREIREETRTISGFKAPVTESDVAKVTAVLTVKTTIDSTGIPQDAPAKVTYDCKLAVTK